MKDKLIQSMGGKARDAALSDERKKEIATKGAAARWADRPIRAIHRGNFKADFGIDVDCYVLDDASKTAVISQRGMGQALDMSTGGAKFSRFLSSKAISSMVGPEMKEKLAHPIVFQWGSSGPERPASIAHGYDVSLLIDICRIIIQAGAEGKLGKRQERVIAQANIICNASAKSGIRNLVYALAGYNPTTQEVIDAFKAYVQEEAKKYEKEFPEELYAQWYKLYEIPVLERGKPWAFKHLTLNHIYFPLAKSNGKITQLLRASKQNGGKRRDKLFQFLNEVGARALRMQLGRVLEMAESSPDRATYEKKILERFGNQPELNLVYASPTIETVIEAEK